MAARHQRRHVARALPGARAAATRAAARSRPWTRTRRGTAGTPAPAGRRRQSARGGADGGEGVARRGRGQHEQPGEDRDEPQVGHHRVPAARRRHRGAVRGVRRRPAAATSAPSAPSRRAGWRRSPATGTSSSATTKRGSAAWTVRPSRPCAGVADAVDRGGGRDRACDGEEQAAERVGRQHDARQRQQAGKIGRPGLPEDGGDTGRRAQHPGEGGADTHHQRPQGPRREQRGDRAHRACGNGRRERDLRQGQCAIALPRTLGRRCAGRCIMIRSQARSSAGQRPQRRDDRLGPRRAARHTEIHRHDVADTARPPRRRPRTPRSRARSRRRATTSRGRGSAS